MATQIISIRMEESVPAGIMGPMPVTLDIRAYLVPHDSGFVLVDTGMDTSGSALDAALDAVGASWSEVSDIVLTHGHADHTDALPHARSMAPGAAVHANALELIDGTEPLVDGQLVGSLRVIATPGHTPGHLSLYDNARDTLLVGDCLGRGPEEFTEDLVQAEKSLHRILEFRGARMLLGHGSVVERSWDALDELLSRN